MTDTKEGLEVVAWQDAENPLYTTGERRHIDVWEFEGYPIVELCRKSDAQVIIDQYKAENERLKYEAEYQKNRANDWEGRNKTLRTQLAEALEILDGVRCFVPRRFVTEIEDWLESCK